MKKQNYKKPYIPEGFEYLKGEWHNGFSIVNKADESIFTWVPVGALESDGTLDGVNFTEKFGRRNFDKYDNFESYQEKIDKEMLDSIKIYGGLYVSSYLASIGVSNGKRMPVFKDKTIPWVSIMYPEIKRLAEEYANQHKQLCSCLPSGAMYDSIFKWLIQFGFKTFEEVVINSTDWGNYSNSKKSFSKAMHTGSKEEWYVCNIADLAGNFYEWSTEQDVELNRQVARGGYYDGNGSECPATTRASVARDERFFDIGWRIVIYKKVA